MYSQNKSFNSVINGSGKKQIQQITVLIRDYPRFLAMKIDYARNSFYPRLSSGTSH